MEKYLVIAMFFLNYHYFQPHTWKLDQGLAQKHLSGDIIAHLPARFIQNMDVLLVTSSLPKPLGRIQVAGRKV